MRVGDTKKAAILGAVALIVVPMAIFRVVAKKPGTVIATRTAPVERTGLQVARLDSTSSTAAIKSENSGALPTEVKEDTFSNEPQPKEKARETGTAGAPQVTAIGNRDRLTKDSETLPFAPFDPGGNERSNRSVSQGDLNAVKIDGPKVRLMGIVFARSKAISLEVNGSTTSYYVGDSIATSITVIGISSDWVTLRTTRGLVRVSVGQEVQL